MILDFKHIKDWNKFTRWRGALHVPVDRESQVRAAIEKAYAQDLHLIVFYVVDLALKPYAQALVKELQANQEGWG